MKLYIRSAEMIFSYAGPAKDTYERLTKGKSLSLNTFYVNEEFGQVFYINTKGYLHVLQKDGPYINDYILTKDNKLKYSSTYCNCRDRQALADFKQLVADAERI